MPVSVIVKIHAARGSAAVRTAARNPVITEQSARVCAATVNVRTGADGAGPITSISATATAVQAITYTRCGALPTTVLMQKAKPARLARLPRGRRSAASAGLVRFMVRTGAEKSDSRL